MTNEKYIKSLFERYYIKLDLSSCWNWEGTLQNGYGILWHKGKRWRAHRLAWLFSGRSFTCGLVLDHICRNRRCVNHNHLREMTNAENVLIGIGVTAKNKVKTHCKKGHPFDDNNTILSHPDPNHVWRRCRTCKNASKNATKKRRNAERRLNRG